MEPEDLLGLVDVSPRHDQVLSDTCRCRMSGKLVDGISDHLPGRIAEWGLGWRGMHELLAQRRNAVSIKNVVENLDGLVKDFLRDKNVDGR